ncbi:hypothetical protein Tco_0387746, partial [Tanacetum coccineum]
EAEAAEAIQLRAEASKFEVVEKSLRDEVESLKERNITLEKEKSVLDVRVSNLAAKSGTAISGAIEKGMQDGLAADIEHGALGRSLEDLVAYNPSSEEDYNAALQELRSLDFAL